MSSSTPRIVADGLTFRLPDGRRLFAALSVGFGRERTALVGRNGTGKTTLLRLLAGDLAPAAGVVHRHARVGWLPQDASRADDRPLARALGIAQELEALARIERGSIDPADFARLGDRWQVREEAAAVLHRVGLRALPLDRPLARVSGGEATRVALARVLLEQPDVLVLDEPTNHLDADGRAAVCRLVQEWTGGAVFASHDRALLDRADRVVELSSLGVREFGGGWRAWREAHAAEAAAAERALEAARLAMRRTEREVREARERQQRRAARGVRSRRDGSQPKLVLNGRRETSQRTAARLGATHERVLVDGRRDVAAARDRVEQVPRIAVALPSTGLGAGELVVELREVAWSPAPDAPPVFGPLSLRVAGPARLAVRGPNGTGKTTLLRLMAGHLAPTTGEVRRGAGALAGALAGAPEAALLDQRGGDLRDDETAFESFRRAHPDVDTTACHLALDRFRFRAAQAHRRVGTLSGGERLRLGLARTLGVVRPPRLLLLDEPTNHLDLDAVEALEETLAGYDGALVVVSHDEAFVESVGVERTITLGR